jgi:hypothetical protein
MNLKTAFAALAFAVAFITVAHAADYVVAYGVSDGVMNMRTGPGVTYPLVAALPSGEQFADVHCSHGWCHGFWGGSGLQGYIAQSGLLPSSEPFDACMADAEARIRSTKPSRFDFNNEMTAAQKKCHNFQCVNRESDRPVTRAELEETDLRM